MKSNGNLKMAARFSGALLVLLCVGIGFADEPRDAVVEDKPLKPGFVRFTAREVCNNSACIVWQLVIDIPKGTDPTAIVACQYRFRDQISYDGGSGFGSTKDKDQQVILTLVAQAGTVPGGKERILMWHEELYGSTTSFVCPVGPDDRLQDMLKLNVKDGIYKFGEMVKVGELGGNPITVGVVKYPKE